MKFKFLEHTADIKFQAFGSSLEEAFENSALAIKKILIKKKVREIKNKKIKITGKDLKSLLYNFLEEILFLLDSENFIFSSVKVRINEKKLELIAELSGDNSENYEFIGSIKAVTYNSMEIKKEKKKFVIQVVLDV